MKGNNALWLIAGVVCLFAAACSSGSSGGGEETVIKAKFAPGELQQLCNEAAVQADAELLAVSSLPTEQRTIENTLIALDTAVADFNDRTSPLILMGYVDPSAAEEASACEAASAAYVISVFTREDLYLAIKDQIPATPVQARLLSETVQAFEKNGLHLAPQQLARIRELKSELSALETEFSANLNNGRLTVEYTGAELSGVPEDVLAGLERTAGGNYVVSTDYPDYLPVMRNATRSEARRRLYYAFLNRAAESNTILLEQALSLRQQIAELLGFSSWADYRTHYRLAGSASAVYSFLDQLSSTVIPNERADMATLLQFKQTIEPAAREVYAWDLMYLAYQLKKRTFTLDEQEVRQYFPMDRVLTGLFALCEQLFGIQIEEAGADTWAPEVTYYKVSNSADGATLGYFYLDLYPRPGKYGHFMAFPVIAARVKNGARVLPVSAIIGNFPAPKDDTPALLSHGEVLALFHEVGHILHMTLGTAPFGSLSAMYADWDFVETPSQTMEYFVWIPEVLNMISGHYTDPERKLPAEMAASIIAARDFLPGYTYSLQLYSTYMDMEFHTTRGSVDVTAVADRLYEQYLGIPQVPGAHDPASFGHLMGGYDAGYYSYFWAEVYAAAVFSRFEAEGVFNSTVGESYRRAILEPANMIEGTEMVRDFLGHDPTPDAFFASLGLN